jgi:hypothetical protein
MTMKILAISLIGLFALAGGAHAQAPVISLICGGIGLEESQPMRSAQGDHALTILFSTQSGSYVAGVKTRVEQPLADVAATHESCGPVASVDVSQPGRYRVSGELNGVKREQWVDLRPSGGGRVVLRWPD